ncbi:GGDEF domain-containing protein [Aliiglaciecola sp. 2_MG-2023]|uniref:tetratricopeptide repeat-containing diguanylate cyclase n=1 Tax=unclassified Aliiglaciecola TaxID=2593648 RepID=UPI0026E35E12|nr:MULTISPECIES: GGDEF domain-containing protein [unclassified Aliiglaciecola]MDO6710412.1 GGDEF domain-containing protein [Aliiglaciecola sp. 2_MG-2023]MDO6751723.1 GGDEF domain-containing protein [Aliiglaciecola sp. 1_MG-2023]
MRFVVISVVFLLSLSIPLTSLADVTTLLHKADKIRSSDFNAFEALMAELEETDEPFETQQKHFYHLLKGYQLTFNGKVDEAIELYKNIESSNASETLKLRALSSLVNNYAVKRDFYFGAKAINRLFDQREKVQDEEALNSSFGIVAIFYNQAQQYELGLKVANQLLARNTTNRTQCFARQIKVESEFELAKVLTDYQYAQESIDFCKSNNEFLVANIIIMTVAESLTNESRIKESLKLLQDAEKQTVESKYPPLIGVFYSLMANNYLLLDQPDLAKTYGLKAYDSIQNFGLTKGLVRSLGVLYKAAEAQGDYQQTVEYLKRFNEAEKAYIDDTKARGLAFQQAKYEKLEQDNTIVILDKQNALLRTQAELAAEQSRNNRLALTLAVSLLILLFVWLYRSRKIQIKLRKLAETDELTGISNRHHFNHRAKRIIDDAENQKQPVSFVLFDLDHFKKVNDTYGHQTGDWALKKSVKEAKLVCRSIDLIGRMGGEEFGIVLPGCNVDEACKVAEICRAAIASIDTHETDHQFKITASFGVADASTCGYSLEKLFAGADTALYESKENGRNRVYQFNQ